MSDSTGGVAIVPTPPGPAVPEATTRLRAQITGDGHAVTVRLHGELCGLSATLLESVLHRLEARRPTHLVLDLRGLDLIDPPGAGVVRRARERARLAGHSLKLISDAGARESG